MEAIICDKCKKLIIEGDVVYRKSEYSKPRFLDLCVDCNDKQKKANEEFDLFYKQVHDIFEMSLKAKEKELENKYFNNKERKDEKESI